MVLLNGLRSTLSGGDSVSNVHGSVIMGEFSWYHIAHYIYTYQNRKGKRKHILRCINIRVSAYVF